MYSQTGRIVGWITDNILHKNVDSSKHMLHKPPGWAWDKSVIDLAIQMGITRTVIHDKNKKTDYWANVDDFFYKGILINRGYGDQFVLPLLYWKMHQYGKPQTKQLTFGFEVKN